MISVSHSHTVRWAAGNGGLAARTAGAVHEMDEAAALEAMPGLGLHELVLGGESYEVERVGSRYCTADELRDYGDRNGDAFGDERRYPDEDIWAAIQAAEEAIEAGCGRSFCRRERDVAILGSGKAEPLPEIDVKSVKPAVLLYDRMALAHEPCTARMVYGAECRADLHEACLRLAASYLRPRIGAENARGQSVDGVYVSYELATGEEGSWTGLPFVDSVIERNRSHRAVIG